MESHVGPSADKKTALFQAIEEKFPSRSLGDDRWYLVALSALAGAGLPELAGDLYTYIIGKHAYSLVDARQRLVRRLREALMKDVAIMGIPKPLEAVFAISATEREEDKDFSFSRENWQVGKENHERGLAWMNEIYRHNRAPTVKPLSSHRDFDWLSVDIIYGLFLSDHTFLDAIETELVVLAGIMVQNTPRETGWHLRGTRRVGVSQEDVELVHQCIELVANFANIPTDKVPRVADIEGEV